MSEGNAFYQFVEYVAAIDDPEMLQEQIEEGNFPDLTLETIAWLGRNQHVIKTILHGEEMSEYHLGGPDFVGFVRDTTQALVDGYTWIYTYYGYGAAVLVAKRALHRESELMYLFEEFKEKTEEDEFNRIFDTAGGCRVKLVEGGPAGDGK